jgi:hypothetical protein
LVVLALITIGLGSQLNKLKLSYGYANLLPPEDPANLEFLEFKELFDDDGMVMVVGADDARLYELENFQKWYNLGQDIKEVSVARPEILEGAALDTRYPLVDSVFSVLRSFNLKKDTTLKKFNFELLAQQAPQSQEELDSLMAVVKSLPFYKDILWKDDAYSTLLMAFVNTDIFNSPDRAGAIDEIVGMINAFTAETGIKTYVSGLPFIRDQMTAKVKSELKLFIFLSALITAIYYFYSSEISF